MKYTVGELFDKILEINRIEDLINGIHPDTDDNITVWSGDAADIVDLLREFKDILVKQTVEI